MNSKGQVSIFIILGVVLMLLTVVFLSTGDLFQKEETYEITEKVDEQFVAVQRFVQNCLDTTAREGLEKIGSQGGYIDPVGAGLLVNYPSSKQGASAFKFIEGSNLVVPYWYYLSSQMDCSGNCYFDSKAPELEGPAPLTIQSQLQTYISNNLDACLDGFTSLSAAGFAVNVSGSMIPKVLIRDNDVRFYLTYPLDVTRGDSVQAITQYAVDQPVPLRPMYNYAALITAAQQQFTFLERHTISVISFNSGPSTRLLPPSTATTYDYVSTVFWLKSRVKQQLQELLMTYVPGLQVANARNFEPVTYAQDDVSEYAHKAIQRVYDNMVLPLNSTEGDDPLAVDGRFDVAFEYLNWPIYFDVNSDGEIIKPHSLSVSDFLFGMQQYDTYYDVSYPVRVAIYDPNAFKGSGYTFAFGLQSNIRGSSPLDENYTLLTGAGNAGTFVCNQDQYNSGDSQVRVVDKKTGQPIGEVALTFTCGTETCSVGTTDGDGSWSGKLPICGGAMMTFVKDDSYAQFAMPISTNLDESVAFGTVSLEPYRILNASVEKKLISKNAISGEWSFSGIARPLDPKEFAIVSYKQLNQQAGTDPVQGAFIYYGGVGYTEETKVKLVPGIYEVTIQSILDEPLIVPKQERSKKVLFKKIKFTIPEVKMDQFPSGSLTFNETTGYWYVSESELDGGVDAVTFFALSPNLPGIPQEKRVIEDLEIIQKANEYVAPNYNSLVPSFGLTTSLEVPTSRGDPIISIQPLFFGDVEPGTLAQFSVSVIGEEEIKTVAVTQPTTVAAQEFAGSTLNVLIPSSAYGPTPVSFTFTFTDGSVVTKSTTVPVKGSSALTSISAQIDGLQPASEYVISNLTMQEAQLRVSAQFADGVTREITDSIFGTQYQTDNDSVVDLGDNGQLLIGSAGQTVISVAFDDKSLEIPITITNE